MVAALYYFCRFSRAISLVMLVLCALVLASVAPRPVDAQSPFPPRPAASEQVVPLYSTATVLPGNTVIFRGPAPPPIPYMVSVSVTNRSRQPATVSYRQTGTLTIAAPAGNLVSTVPSFVFERLGCQEDPAMPHVVTCNRVRAEPPTEVTFTADPIGGRSAVEAALDLGAIRPCIPESSAPICDPVREALWLGDPAAWAGRGVSDPDARFAATFALRLDAGDPVAQAMIATALGMPYLKITRLRFVGSEVAQADEFIEVTNLGGGVQPSVRWNIGTREQGATRLWDGPALAPGQSCRIYTNSMIEGACAQSNGRGVDAWPDQEGTVVLYFDRLNLIVDEARYSADPANQPPPPNLQLVTTTIQP